MYIKQILIIFVSGFGLTACETTTSAMGFKNSVQQNLAVQIINPEPSLEKTAETTSGEKLALAVKRYNEGNVIQPKTLKLVGTGRTGSSK